MEQQQSSSSLSRPKGRKSSLRITGSFMKAVWARRGTASTTANGEATTAAAGTPTKGTFSLKRSTSGFTVSKRLSFHGSNSQLNNNNNQNSGEQLSGAPFAVATSSSSSSSSSSFTPSSSPLSRAATVHATSSTSSSTSSSSSSFNNNNTNNAQGHKPLSHQKSTTRLIKDTVRTVILSKNPDEVFGFGVFGGSEHDLTLSLSKLVPGGVADKSQVAFVGDEIHAINGEIVIGSTHDEAIQLIKASGHTLTLQLRYSSQTPGNVLMF